MAEARVGFGYDVHRFGGPGPVTLCGVEIDHDTGLLGTSDADVATHAVCDAILGAAAIGDLGTFFPSDDPQWQGARSLDMATRCATMAFDRGFELQNIDVTIVVEHVRIAPHREAMRGALAGAVRLPLLHGSVKATTTDGLGWIGAGEGIAAQAVAMLSR